MTTETTPPRRYALDAPTEESPTPTLHLYDVIGEDLLGGTPARLVAQDLDALGDVPEIVVRLNSPGGDVFEGIAIYNALVRHPARVTVHVDGIAASIASLVAMAGDRTVVAENAMFMVHRPWTAVVGDAEEMRRQAGTLDKAWSAMLATYQRRTGRRAAKIEKDVADAGGEWWLTAEEAVAAGFADAVEKTAKKAQAFGLARFRRVPERLAASSDEGGVPAPEPPRVVEIAPPPVEGDVPPPGMSRAARRRVVEVLRLSI